MELDLLIQKFIIFFEKTKPIVNMESLLASAVILFTLSGILTGLIGYGFNNISSGSMVKLIRNHSFGIFLLFPIIGLGVSLIYTSLVLLYCALIAKNGLFYWFAFGVSVFFVIGIAGMGRLIFIVIREKVLIAIYKDWKNAQKQL